MRVPAAKRGVSTRSLYTVHPGVAMMQDWVATLKPKTGRRLQEWIALVKRAGPPGEAARREWLKREHGLGTNSAWWIAERAEGKGAEDTDPDAYLAAAERWVDALFSGGKAGLRPLYDALLELGLSIGKDVKACPGKTIVPLYRKHVFAQLKPAARTRLDLGLALALAKGPLPKRLADTGGREKGDRITHRIPIETASDIDDEVRRWLRTAYELDR
jgi:hypothetical protein